MRRWSRELRCPKCGNTNMEPRWAGELLMEFNRPRRFIGIGFSAMCVRCGYEEEVLPLDAPEEVTNE